MLLRSIIEVWEQHQVLKGKYIFKFLSYNFHLCTYSLLLFNPNEIVDDNSMVAMMVKQNVILLQKCLKSKTKELYFAAIDSVNNASNMFGPAINKHLPHILPLI